MIGRFFFTHQARARRDNEEITTCEFLHATFGEFLIPRLLVRELAALAEATEFNAARNRPATPDDALLYALLSFSPLSKRWTILQFTSEIADSLPSSQRETMRHMILAWFHTALEPRTEHRHHAYEPVRLSVTARPAAYTANLLLLAGIIGGRRITGRELFPNAADFGRAWRAHALLWRSQLNSDGWAAMAEVIEMRRTWDGDRREVEVEVALVQFTERGVDLYWSDRIPPSSSLRGNSGWVRHLDPVVYRDHRLLATTGDLLIHALEPLIFADPSGEQRPLVTAIAAKWPDRCVSAAHALIRLWVTSGLAAPPEELVAAYEDCFTVAESAFDPAAPQDADFFLQLVIRQLTADTLRLPTEWHHEAHERAARMIHFARASCTPDWEHRPRAETLGTAQARTEGTTNAELGRSGPQLRD